MSEAKLPSFPWIIPIHNGYTTNDDGKPEPFFINNFLIALILHEDGSVTWDIQ